MKPVIKQLTQLDDIYKTLLLFDADFVPSLSERGLDLKAYAQKLFEFAMVYTLCYENLESGFVAFYANDTVNRTAYLAQIAVKSQFINRGFGYILLLLTIKTSKEKGMETMKLEVDKHNHSAISFYVRNGFSFCDDVPDAFNYMMQKKLLE